MLIERKYKQIKRNLLTGAFLLLSLFLLGTVWYAKVEGWSWLDAAYMTIITLSTVGFLEVQPLGTRGRLFTMVLILLGVIIIGYIVNRFTEAVIEGYFQAGIRRRQEQAVIDSLMNHHILCGFGRIGRQVAQELQTEGISFIIIDSQAERVEKAQELGYLVLQEDATLDESLQKARIDKAVCLISTLSSDAENLYTVLSAKTLNPKIRAISRASTEEAVKKLQRAGADAVVSPYITGGKRLAAVAVRPQVMDFVDGILTDTERSFYLEEFLLDPEICPCIGQTLSEARLRSRAGVLVLAIRRSDGSLVPGPMGDTRLLPGDLLICMGTAEQLRSLNGILGPISNHLPRLPKQM